MKNVESFKCDFCDKLFTKEEGCIKHENKCSKNPCVRVCGNCCNLDMDYDYNRICLAEVEYFSDLDLEDKPCDKWEEMR